MIYFEELPFVDFHPYDLQIEPERVTRVVFEGGQGIVQDWCQKFFLAEAHGQIFFGEFTDHSIKSLVYSLKFPHVWDLFL